MARPIDIIVKVRDAASAPMKKIEEQMGRTGQQAVLTSKNFTDFNRTMFATTAFVGMFSMALGRLGQGMMEAAKMDRVVDQFERAVGPKGEFFKAISQMTDNSIDRVEAMRSAIALRTLGISKDINQTADMIARAGTAAKLAGLDSGEGIKKFTDFMKDGSISHLEFLNVLKRTDTGLQVGSAILHKYGGVMGGAMTTAMKLAVGQNLLRKATEGSMKGNRDYLDTLQDFQQASQFAKKETMLLVTAAFAPMLEKIKDLLWTFSDLTERIRKNDKEILFLVKVFGTAAVAAGTLVATLGTLRLSVMALGKLGLGIPMLSGALGMLGIAFLGVTHNVNTFTEKLKVFGGVFMGTFQLVKSFLDDPDNFAKGIGKMDTALANLLKSHGLFDLVVNISRVTASITMFVRGAIDGFTQVSAMIAEKVGYATKKILQLLGIDAGPWSRMWVEGIENVGKTIGKLTAGILAAVSAFKAFGMAKNLLSKIPFIGDLFGGGGMGGKGGPKGTIGDPIYVTVGNKIATLLGDKSGKVGEVLKRKIPEILGIFSSGLSKRLLGAVIGGLGLGMLVDKLVDKFDAANPPKTEKEKNQRSILPGAGAAAGTLIGALGFDLVFKFIKEKFLKGFTTLWKTVAAVTAGKKILGKKSGAIAAADEVTRIIKTVGPLTTIFTSFGRIISVIVPILARFSLVSGIIYTAFELLAGATDSVIENWSQWKDLGSRLYNDLTTGISSAIDYIKNAASNMGSSISSMVGNMVSGTKDALGGMWNGMKNIGSSVVGVVKDTASTIGKIEIPGLGTVADQVIKFHDAIKKFVDWFTSTSLYKGAVEGTKMVSEGIDSAKEWLANKMNSVIDIAKTAGNILANPYDEAKKALDNAAVIAALNNTKNAEQQGKLAAHYMGAGGLLPEEVNATLPGSVKMGKYEGADQATYLSTIQSRLRGDQQDRFQQAYSAAMNEQSAGGNIITPEEMQRILEYALGNAMEPMIKATSSLDSKTEKKSTATNQTSRGGC